MANILFISINDINAHGLRILSSYLKSKGHTTSIIFLKRPGFPYSYKEDKYFIAAKQVDDFDWIGIYHDGTPFRYCRGPSVTHEEKTILFNLIKKLKPDLIGFYVTSPLINRIARTTKEIKDKYHGPVIWGGPGATLEAERCVEYSDFVCIGEGEKTILEIAERIDADRDIKDVRGLCYRSEGKTTRNELFELIQDLDMLPFQDVDSKNKFLIEDDTLTEDYNEISYSGRYHIIGSRGCLFNCSYCAESYYKQLYTNEHFLRRRSPENIIREIKEASVNIEFTNVQFEDEIFPLEYDWLKKFADMYSIEVNRSFSCYIYPIRNLDKQLTLLKEIGVFDVCLSLQSGSKRINRDVFKRPFKSDLYVDTAEKLQSLGISFYTDIITYNPFETEEDLKETLNILLAIPKPAIININKLHVLDNTALWTLIKEKDHGLKVNQVPERIFYFYARLFRLSFSENKKFIRLCTKIWIFRMFPALLCSERIIALMRFITKLF